MIGEDFKSVEQTKLEFILGDQVIESYNQVLKLNFDNNLHNNTQNMHKLSVRKK